jgi:predicted nucleic acid-binding protein
MINLDANIVINLLDEETDTQAIEKLIAEVDVCVTPITVHVVWYFFDKNKIKCSKKKMLEFFDFIEIIPMSKNTYKKALILSKEEDIEDGMQVACCIENKIDKIITSDAGMYAKYSKNISIKLIK